MYIHNKQSDECQIDKLHQGHMRVTIGLGIIRQRQFVAKRFNLSFNKTYAFEKNKYLSEIISCWSKTEIPCDKNKYNTPKTK